MFDKATGGMNKHAANWIGTLCKGNPGALRVLLEISKSDPMFLNPLGIAMEMTGTKSYALWLVYKDKCNFDLNATKKALQEWFDNSTEPLEKYLEEQGIR